MEQIDIDNLFERRLTFPDPSAQERYSSLVGIDEFKERLVKFLTIMLDPSSLDKWAKKAHLNSDNIKSLVLARPPLVIFHGDVGTGKTELAETIGDAVARQSKKPLMLFPISLSTRGEGKVGEMTRLISSAFNIVFDETTKLMGKSGKVNGGIILFIDEADALAQSREAQQMHHEDRAGVNALIRGIDRLTTAKCPAAVIMCTNRLNALDPAVRRRAAEIFSFSRPNQQQAENVLTDVFSKLFKFRKDQIDLLIQVAMDKEPLFTYSDFRQRFIPSVIMNAFPDKAVIFDDAFEILKSMSATPPFNEKIEI